MNVNVQICNHQGCVGRALTCQKLFRTNRSRWSQALGFDRLAWSIEESSNWWRVWATKDNSRRQFLHSWIFGMAWHHQHHHHSLLGQERNKRGIQNKDIMTTQGFLALMQNSNNHMKIVLDSHNLWSKLGNLSIWICNNLLGWKNAQTKESIWCHSSIKSYKDAFCD